MDLKSLHYFITVIESGSFMEASRKVRIAQPSLSWQIKKLEDELGVVLLIRHSRGVEATEAGLLLLDHARDILTRTSIAIAQLRNLDAVPQGAVFLGMTPSVNALLTVPLLQRLATEASDIQLNPTEELSSVLTEWVADGRLDMAISLQVHDHPDLVYEPILGEPMFFVESAKNSKSIENHITFKNAVRRDLVMTPMSPWFRTLLDETAREKKIKVSIKSNLLSIATLRDIVAQGPAATIQPYGVVMREVATGVLRASRIVDPEITRSVCLVTNRTRSLSRAAKVARDIIMQIVAEIVSSSSGIWIHIHEDQIGRPGRLAVDGVARIRYQSLAKSLPSQRKRAYGPRQRLASRSSVQRT